MPETRGSIAQIMMAIALVAVNLALVRTAPQGVVMYPTLWIFLGSIDFVIVWKLILKRTLRAFHYTFLIVFVVAFVVTANLVATERLHPLGLVVGWYQQLAGENTIRISPGYVGIGEFWMTSFLTFMLAWAIGSVAAWLERRRDWDIAAFWRERSLVSGLQICWRSSMARQRAGGSSRPLESLAGWSSWGSV